MRDGFRSNVWAVVYFQNTLKFGTTGESFRDLNLLTQFFTVSRSSAKRDPRTPTTYKG